MNIGHLTLIVIGAPTAVFTVLVVIEGLLWPERGPYEYNHPRCDHSDQRR